MEDTDASLGAYLDSVGLSWPCIASSAFIATDDSKASLGRNRLSVALIALHTPHPGLEHCCAGFPGHAAEGLGQVMP